MNEANLAPVDPEGQKPRLNLKFIGVGGAGCHIVDYLVTAGFSDLDFIAVDTERQALQASQAKTKYHLGAQITRGLGVGGDPELGWAAAEKEAEQLSQICAGADIIFLAAGLGRGTGTGASPVLARVAREGGALVLAFAIFPFECEGRQRQQQAQRGFQLLKTAADGVICLQNQKLSKLVDNNTSLVETFRFSNELLTQGLRGIWRLLNRPGLIQVDFAHLVAVLRGRHAESSFGMAEAVGPNRAQEVVEKLLASPLLGEGQLLAEADAVLVSIAGGCDLSLAEVNRVMEAINGQCGQATITLGASLDETLNDRLEVTLVASSRNKENEEITPNAAADDPGAKMAKLETAGLELRITPIDKPAAARFLPPPPSLDSEQTQQLIKQQSGGRSRLKKVFPRLRQGQLPLEIISKGRFEKSEPTIHNGEDLDVPTFKRRGVILN